MTSVALIAALAESAAACGTRWEAEREYLAGLGARKGEASGTPLEHFNRAIELDGTNAAYYEARSMEHSNGLRFAAALRDIDKAVSLSPRPYLLFERGFCKLDVGMPAAGLEDFQLALRQAPLQAQFYKGVAEAEMDLDRPDEALGAIDRALLVGPQVVEWRYVRGVALSRLGRREDAIAQFDRTSACTQSASPGLPEIVVFYNGATEYERTRTLSPPEIRREYREHEFAVCSSKR